MASSTQNTGVNSAEGFADVGEARLAYRLVNPKATGPTLVFENGWGASFHYWAWLEAAMGNRCRMLFYDRAGIGGSSTTGPLGVDKLTRHFATLLQHLGIASPVIVVGHSYGGLMAGLHAAVAPELISKAIQLDPTPELDEPAINKQLAAVKGVGRLAQACALLGVPDPIFSPACRELPPEAGRQLQKQAFGNRRSIGHALEELALAPGIRSAIAAAPATPSRPLLVVSAAEATVPKSGVWKLFVNADKARQLQQSMMDIHRTQARGSSQGRWDSLPFAHGEMIFTEQGANRVAERIRQEIGSQGISHA